MPIRAATRADIPAMRALDLASPFGARWSEEHYQGFFAARDSQRHLVLMTEVQGDAIAYLAASGVGEEWELENVIVAADKLRRGIARALIEGLIERLRREGVQRLHLEVRQSNQAARSLYAGLGFAEAGRRTQYYANPGEDAVLFTFSF